MPIYEYKCKNCGYICEFIESINSKHIDIPCPKCGKRKLQRLISRNVSGIVKGEDTYRSINYINQKAKEDGILHTERKKHKESL